VIDCAHFFDCSIGFRKFTTSSVSPATFFFQTVGFIPIFSNPFSPEIKYIEIKIRELGYKINKPLKFNDLSG